MCLTLPFHSCPQIPNSLDLRRVAKPIIANVKTVSFKMASQVSGSGMCFGGGGVVWRGALWGGCLSQVGGETCAVWLAQSGNCHKTLFQTTSPLVRHTRTALKHKDSESLRQGHLLDMPSYKTNTIKQPAVALTSSFSECHFVPTHQPEHVSSQARAKCQPFKYFL